MPFSVLTKWREKKKQALPCPSLYHAPAGKLLKLALPVRLVSHVDGKASSHLNGEFAKQKFSYGQVFWGAWLMSDVRQQDKTSMGQEARIS